MAKQVDISKTIKEYKIKLPMINDSHIYIIFGKTLKDIRDNYKYFKNRDDMDGMLSPGKLASTMFFGSDTGFTLAMIYGIDNIDDIDRTIVHECFHMTGEVADAFGFQYDFNNDEPMAYLMDYLYSETKKNYLKYIKHLNLLENDTESNS